MKGRLFKLLLVSVLMVLVGIWTNTSQAWAENGAQISSPALDYFTYFGGSDFDGAAGIAMDAVMMRVPGAVHVTDGGGAQDRLGFIDDPGDAILVGDVLAAIAIGVVRMVAVDAVPHQRAALEM